MAKYSRPPENFRFEHGGLNTTNPVDTLLPSKYPLAVNIRGTLNKAITTRPGYTQVFTAGGAITDIRAYSTLGTDNLPRVLARRTNNGIYLDDGVLKSTLAGTANGVFMIPYRPNQSPQSWMYIGSDGDYQKLSAPDATNAVTAYKVGIREPTTAPDVSQLSLNFYNFSALAAGWANAGTAGVDADAVRVADVAGVALAHPGSNSILWSVQVATNVSYQTGMIVTMGPAGAFTAVVQDVCPPIQSVAGITIQSIEYFARATGRCVIVPSQMPTTFGGNVISSLKRGSLINLSGGGGEIVLVHSVTVGADGTIAIETSTTGAHAAGETITGRPAIVVSDINATVVGNAISSASITSALGAAGIGTLTQALAANPFAQALAPSTNMAQEDDYICFGIQLDNLSVLVQGIITFDIKNGAADYVTDTLYYIFNIESIILPSLTASRDAQDQTTSEATAAYQAAMDDYYSQLQELQSLSESEQAAIAASYGYPLEYVTSEMIADYVESQIGAPPSASSYGVTSLTPLPTSQWGLVRIPIRALTRVGNDDTRTLANCQGVQISIQTTGAANLAISSFWVGGGGQLDTGSNRGYFYRFRGRNSETGARGNPSPATRYGARPGRQQVRIEITDTTADAQVDTFDVYRFGGSVAEWRQVGSVRNVAPVVFTDNFSDAAALAGTLLETDNHEPWPTIDVPFTVDTGGGNTIVVEGTLVTVSGAGITWPSTILRWLPGTIIQISGIGSYTLRERPTQMSATSYRFELSENAGFIAAATSFRVREPIVANQHLPYLFGPNQQGDIFACGDSLRPGNIYFCNQHNPDSASDQRNIEITPPSEPLLGGEVLAGLALVSSSDRWWALYPAYDTPQKYYKVERQIGRGLAAPYGHCTDGNNIYFWAKDGIWVTDGSKGKSLTDRDLYNLFPHEGSLGANITYNGIVTYAPDYKRAVTFRLGFCGGFLYADYQDINGVYHTLVYDSRLDAWSVDEYASPAVVHYGVEQPAGTLLATTTLYPLLLMGHLSGVISRQTPNTNDLTTPISCIVATGEYNGGDIRSFGEWGDLYVESLPRSSVSVTPISNGTAIAGATVIGAAAIRAFSQISLGGGSLQKFLGLTLTWTDNFTVVSGPTTLFLWQPSVLLKPETTTDRAEDWDDLGDPRVKYIRGFVIEADTFNAAKTFYIRNKDDNTTTSYTITHNGQAVSAFEFATPILSHLVRVEPQGATSPWRFFQVKYDFEIWPELTQEYSFWFDMESNDRAKYVRGLVIPVDTNGAAVVLRIVTSDGATITLPAVTTTAGQKTPVAFSFTVPLIGHEFQIRPQSDCRLWFQEAQWHYETWPELTAEASPWMSAGQKGAKYFRSVTIPVDTNGASISLTLYSSDDGSSVVLGPFTTTAGRKTEVAAAIPPPFVGHEVQIIPSGVCRIWHDEIRWVFDPYPEIVPAYTSILQISDPKAKYVQGIRLTADTGNVSVQFNILYDGATVGPNFSGAFNGKQTKVFAFDTPFIAHNLQLVPQAAARIWVDESQWEHEPTPDELDQWGPTQQTSHGFTGYMHIGYLEIAYQSTAPILFAITGVDGGSPDAITLPSTGGVYYKTWVRVSPNKARAYRYRADSAAVFRLFLPDTVIWVKQWGSEGPYEPKRILGDIFGEKARV